MARTPRLGGVKSRLAASAGDGAALALQIAFLRDTAALMTRVAAVAGARLAVAWSEARPRAPELTRTFGAFLHLRQPAGDLGARLLAAQQAAHAGHGGPIVAIGGDSPTLPATHLMQALAALASHEVVMAPAADGGYVLLGVRAPRLELLAGMPWGSAAVAARTRAAARLSGLSFAELETWYDVDDGRGLRRLGFDLECGRARGARWTARALMSMTAVTGEPHA